MIDLGNARSALPEKMNLDLTWGKGIARFFLISDLRKRQRGLETSWSPFSLTLLHAQRWRDALYNRKEAKTRAYMQQLSIFDQ